MTLSLFKVGLKPNLIIFHVSYFEVVYACQHSDAKNIPFRRKLKKCSPMLNSISFISARNVLKLMAFHQIHFVSMEAMFLASTVLCKSNANEFRRNSRLFGAFRSNFAQDDSSMKFPRFFMTPIVLIRTIFRTIIRFAR